MAKSKVAKAKTASQRSALKKQAAPNRSKAKHGKGLAVKTPVRAAKPLPSKISVGKGSSQKEASPVRSKALESKATLQPKMPTSKSATPAAKGKSPLSKSKALEKAELQAVLTQKAKVSLSGAESRKVAKPEVSAPKKGTAAVTPPSAPANLPGQDRAPEATRRAGKISAAVSKKEKAAAQKALEAQEDLSNAGKKWLGLYNQLRNTRTKPYDMSASYDVKSGIQHKTLGWGYVVETRGDRMDVLFKDGMKTLVINYVKG